MNKNFSDLERAFLEGNKDINIQSLVVNNNLNVSTPGSTAVGYENLTVLSSLRSTKLGFDIQSGPTFATGATELVVNKTVVELYNTVEAVNINNISAPSHSTGALVLCHTTDNGYYTYDVTFKNATGNILCGADITMATVDAVVFQRDANGYFVLMHHNT